MNYAKLVIPIQKEYRNDLRSNRRLNVERVIDQRMERAKNEVIRNLYYPF